MRFGSAASLDDVTGQLEPHLPQLATLGYKVKFALENAGVILVDASQTPATLSAPSASR